MRKITCFLLLALVCTSTGCRKQVAQDVADSFSENMNAKGERLAKWLRPDPKLPDQPVAESYCYRSLQDVLCYRQPMPGWETRLVGYQGTNATPPAPGAMQLLPTNTPAAAVSVAADKGPAQRVAKAKPVFVTPPPEVKEESKSDVPTTVDASHEALPDPALAPQL